MKQRFITALLAAAGCAVLMTGCGTDKKDESSRDSTGSQMESSTDSLPSAVDPTDSLMSDAEGLVSDVIDGGEEIMSDVIDGGESMADSLMDSQSGTEGDTSGADDSKEERRGSGSHRQSNR